MDEVFQRWIDVCEENDEDDDGRTLEYSTVLEDFFTVDVAGFTIKGVVAEQAGVGEELQSVTVEVVSVKEEEPLE